MDIPNNDEPKATLIYSGLPQIRGQNHIARSGLGEPTLDLASLFINF